jgi:hypothetical protein
MKVPSLIKVRSIAMNKKLNFPIVIIFILGIIIFWTTSYPTIIWWEASEYSAAAACLGLTGAPGSIILTFLGWILSKFASHNPAYLFNLSAGVIASLTVVCSFLVFRKIIEFNTGKEQNDFSIIEILSLIIASGIVICCTTLWEYAIMFTPYILTALFTMIILMAVLKWWKNAERPDSWKSLFLITLLIGIDFSVHRTNTVLIPGIIFIMLIRNYRVFFNYKSYLAAISGIILGLSIQLLYIPMSLNDPLLNLGETNTLSSWWNFISLKQYGGSFLTDIFVRKGSLWSYQIPYYLKGFSTNFFYPDHFTVISGFIPAVTGLTGIVYLFKTNRKLATALFLFFIITISFSIIYFNLPENYFRAIYRHYLPTYMIFSVFIFAGTFYLFNEISKLLHKTKWIFISIILFLLMGTFLTQYFTNFKSRNGSDNTIAYDHSGNILKSVGENGILFSFGDNDYFPEMYVQIGDNQRPDITQCCISLLNLDWYINQTQKHDKKFPFTGKGINTKQIEYENWETDFCSIPIDDNIKKKYSLQTDTFHFSLPALRENKTNLLQDLVLFDIIKSNKWGRPLYFLKSGFDSALYNWLSPYLCDEGLVYKFVPDSSHRINLKVIEANLNKFNITGYNNNSITLDNISHHIGLQYYESFLNVAKNKAATGDPKTSAVLLKKMKELLPFDRLQPDENTINETKELEESIKN